MELTAYERSRDARVEENNAMLAQLGLLSSKLVSVQSKKRDRVRRYQPPPGSPRKCRRFQNSADVIHAQLGPSYVDDVDSDDDNGKRNQSRKKKCHTTKKDSFTHGSPISRRAKRSSVQRPGTYCESDLDELSHDESDDESTILFPTKEKNADETATSSFCVGMDASDLFCVPIPLVDVGSALYMPPFY